MGFGELKKMPVATASAADDKFIFGMVDILVHTILHKNICSLD